MSYTKRALDFIPATEMHNASWSDEQPSQPSETISETSRNIQPDEVRRPLDPPNAILI
jgi:hypothetical protein